MPTVESKPVAIQCAVTRESDRFYWFICRNVTHCVPKRLAKRTATGLVVPDWLAKDKGFIIHA